MTKYRIPLLVSGETNFLRSKKFKNSNSFPILCTEFLKTGETIQGEIIQGRMLIK